MIKRLASDNPTKSGFYFCEVEKESMDSKFIAKSALWYSVDSSMWLTHNTPDRVIAWYDDGEENQNELWDDAVNIICEHLGEELPSPSSIQDCKKRYTIYRK